ncbi:acyltransferase [Haloterrigena alkaliphila]|uniref:Acyltransferase family protein n=1 Tax=Haloterrigena alkaliphila TaxID=2816475 RepID=A0A8A2VL33_9EURY|nr:acyltransferase family protein [Haloterrigena alkaliphila]QSX01033.1 acyltransferase family protein [Haloterrigena alkaliphila]
MRERIYSIDAVRAVAMAFIVAIHADLFRGLGATGNAVNLVIDTVGRFAVPFFFLTSGYLFARKCTRTEPAAYVRAHLERVGSIYGYAVLGYFPLVLLVAAGGTARAGGDVSSAVLARALEALSPLGLLYYGDSVLLFLWFLPSLAISIALVYAVVAVEKTRYLLPVAATFHVVGILDQSYPMLVDVPFVTRDALFFGFFYTSVGYCIGSWQWSPSRDRSGLYLAATVTFGAIHLAERYVLGYVLTGDSIAQGVYVTKYTATTPLFATALFVYVLSRPTLGKGTGLPWLGSHAVWIYVVHPLVLFSLVGVSGAVELLGYDLGESALWHVALSTLTYAGALAISLFLTRTTLLRRASRVTSRDRLRTVVNAMVGGRN